MPQYPSNPGAASAGTSPRSAFVTIAEKYPSAATTYSSQSWGTPFGTAMDVEVGASEGDTIVASLNMEFLAGGPLMFVDIGVVVAGAVVRRISGDNDGVPSWLSRGADRAAGDFYATVQPGDIDGGTVTLRPVFLCNAAGTRTFADQYQIKQVGAIVVS